MDRTLLRRALLLFVAALAVRAAAAAAFGIGGPPVEDERDYFQLAHSLGSGRGFLLWGEYFEISARTSMRPPLLPLVLAPVAALGGDEAAMRCVSIVLGALSAPLAYAGLRRTSLGERAVWVGAALAVWPPAVYLSLRMLAEPLAAAMLLLALAVPADRDDRVAPDGRSSLAGVFAALSVLARPAALPAAVLIAFTRGGARRAAWFGVGLACMLAPWIVRGWVLHGRPLLTTNTGVTLVGANSAAAAAADVPGKWLEPKDVYAGAADPPDLGMWGWSNLSESENDRRFTNDAFTWIREHPADAARLCSWKLVRLFDPDQHSAKADAGLKRWLGWATFAPVLLLALLGLPAAWREPEFRPWLAVLAGTVLTTLVFYGDVRMRSPADPTLLAVAALAVSRRLPSPRGSDGARGRGGRT